MFKKSHVRTPKAAPSRVFALLALFGLMGTQACLSFSSGSETVIERSSKEAPSWIKTPTAMDSPREVYAVTQKREVFKLDLGLKQAQAAAIQNTKPLFQARFQQELLLRAKEPFPKGVSSSLQAELVKTVAEVMENFTPTDGVSRNVYWEQVRRETAEGPRTHHNIWVLLGLRRDDLDEALSLAAQKLRTSNQEDAQRVGSAIVESYE